VWYILSDSVVFLGFHFISNGIQEVEQVFSKWFHVSYFGLADLKIEINLKLVMGYKNYKNVMPVVSCIYFELADLHEHHASCVMLIFWAGRFT
jgi:hypothetical protein